MLRYFSKVCYAFYVKQKIQECSGSSYAKQLSLKEHTKKKRRRMYLFFAPRMLVSLLS